MKSPVLFLIFNRPEFTFKVFSRIKEAKPARLYIAADGPRESKGEKEVELCRLARSVVDKIDWQCEVKLLFREKNLGCGKAVSEAITWFFDNEPEGIIIEDDIYVHPDFFEYCDLLLEKYRDCQEIMLICGRNFQFGESMTENSYYFSAIAKIWGWASWRRSWKLYDYYLNKYPLEKVVETSNKVFDDKGVTQYFCNIYNSIKNKSSDTWDFQLFISTLCNNSYCIIPNNNLVENIGIGLNATHTRNIFDKNIKYKYSKILPLIHPEKIEYNKDIDIYISYKYTKTYMNFKRKAILYLKSRVIILLKFAKILKLYQKYKNI